MRSVLTSLLVLGMVLPAVAVAQSGNPSRPGHGAPSGAGQADKADKKKHAPPANSAAGGEQGNAQGSGKPGQ